MFLKISRANYFILFLVLTVSSLSHQARPAWPTEQHDNQKSGFFPFPAQGTTRPQPFLSYTRGDSPAAGKSWVTSANNDYLFSAFFAQTYAWQINRNDTISHVGTYPSSSNRQNTVNAITAMESWQNCTTPFAMTDYEPENNGHFLYLYCFGTSNGPPPFGPYTFTTAPLSYTNSNITGVLVGAIEGLFSVIEDTSGNYQSFLYPGSVLALAMDLFQNIYTLNQTTLQMWSSYPNIQPNWNITIPTGLCPFINGCFLTVDQGYNVIYVYGRGSNQIAAYYLANGTLSWNNTFLDDLVPYRQGALSDWSNSTAPGKYLILPSKINASAINLQSNGNVVWTFGSESDQLTNPIVDSQGIAYLADGAGTLYGINATSGNLLWESIVVLVEATTTSLSMGPYGEIITEFNTLAFFNADLKLFVNINQLYYPMNVPNVTINFNFTTYPGLQPYFSALLCRSSAPGGYPPFNMYADLSNNILRCYVDKILSTQPTLSISYLILYSSGTPDIVEEYIGTLTGVDIYSISPKQVNIGGEIITVTGTGFSACNRTAFGYDPCYCVFDMNQTRIESTQATYIDNTTITCMTPYQPVGGEDYINMTLQFASEPNTNNIHYYWQTQNWLRVDYITKGGSSHKGLIITLVVIGVLIVVVIVAAAAFTLYRKSKNKRYVPLGETENKRYTSWS